MNFVRGGVRAPCVWLAAVLLSGPFTASQPVWAAGDEPPAARFILGSTVKLEQLFGDFDKERKRPTPNRTFTRFSVLGTDLGYSLEPVMHFPKRSCPARG
jgi:hypothetical protein